MFHQTHLTFGKVFTQAVELKQVAQQEAQPTKRPKPRQEARREWHQ